MGRAAAAFWRFSLRAYRAPGVAEACLALQEGCGADVNLLLFCGWLGRRGKRLSARELRTAASLVSRWQTNVVGSLRQARRAIAKNDKKLKGLRKRVAALELKAERVEQRWLAEYGARLAARRPAAAPDCIRDNLARYFWLLEKR